MELDHEAISGSAFLVESPAWFPRGARALYTNFHVVEGNPTKDVLLFFALFGKVPVRARIVRAYPQCDLAILQVSRSDAARLSSLPNLQISKDHVPKFTTAYALGFPLGCEDVQISEGVVSGWEDSHYHLNISINSGNSGGPVLMHTPQGERVIAVSVATLCGAEAIGLGIPMLFIDDILRVPQLNPKGDHTELCIESTAVARVRGPIVMTVHKDDSLYAMGFRKADEIICLNGAPVDAYGMLTVSWMDIPVHWMEANLMRRCLSQGGTAIVRRKQHRQVQKGAQKQLCWTPVHGCIPAVRTVYPFYEDTPYVRAGGVVLVPFSLNLIAMASHTSLTKDLALCAIEPTECHTQRSVVSYIDTFSELYIGDRVELFDVVTHLAGEPVRSFKDLLTLSGVSKKRKLRSMCNMRTLTLNDVVLIKV
jgi:hypothetical protein